MKNSRFLYFIGAWAKAGNPKKLLSEQQSHDCEPRGGGCGGGGPNGAFANAIVLGGVATREEYPYEARDSKIILETNKHLFLNTYNIV